MKRVCILLLIIVTLLACKKEPELKTYALEITRVEVEAGTTNVNIRATYSYPAELKSVYIKISHNADMSSSDNHLTTLDGNTINVEINDLDVVTKYYYCFEYNNGVSQATTSVLNFITTDYSLPIVNTKEVTNITATSAECGGNVTDDGGTTITARGVCWGTSHNPTTNNSHTNDDQGLGVFVSSITGLETNVTYFVRAYATNSKGISYGEERSFTTQEGLAAISTNSVTNITSTSAMSGGNITDDGGFSITARGVCWGTMQNPTTTNNHTNDGSGLGEFSSSITGLELNVTYYVRAYATNSKGTTYGQERGFTTKDGLAIITTTTISNITTNSAVSGGNITDDGGYDITERGVCWSILQNPTINDYHTNDGSGNGMFTSSLTELYSNTRYFVRAYATNSVGTSYGNEVGFTTSQIPNYTISVSSNPNNAGSATGGGVFQQGQSCTVTATANDNYDFLCWTENGNQVSSDINYSFIVTGDRLLVAEFGFNPIPPEGAINGVFSVSDTKLVWFSRGNLQRLDSDLNQWVFAENQWDYLGNNGQGNSGLTDVDRDLFIFGTTPSSMEQWRVLTSDEWLYLLDARSTNSGIRYAKANVNNVNGLIILPDNWDENHYLLNYTNISDISFNSNIISSSIWVDCLEVYGAVFLPAAGYCEANNGISVSYEGVKGYYWSLSTNSSTRYYYYCCTFDDNYIYSSYPESSDRNRMSIRMIKDIN